MFESNGRADVGAAAPVGASGAVPQPHAGSGRPTGRRILLLAPFPPRLDGTHGGSKAIAQLVVALASRNRVALGYLRAHDEPAIDAELAQHCEQVVEGARGGSSASSVRPFAIRSVLALIRPLLAGLPLWVAGRWSASFARRVRDLAATWQPDIVQAELSVMGQYVPTSMRRSAPVVVSFHEPAAAAATERVTTGGVAAPLWRVEARRWRRFERDLLSRIDAAIVFTRRDADALRSLHASHAPEIEIIPLAVAEPDASLGEDANARPRRIVFVGNFMHPPNADAARFLVEEIFPPLREQFADLELYVVGPGAPPWLVSSEADGIFVTGLVASVAPHLARATVVVAPIRQGGGMRVKVLEAMAAGRAIVATPLAVEGINAADGRELLVAGDAADFRRRIAELLDDPTRRSALGRAARARVAEEHSSAAVAAAYESVYARLAASRARG